jgi:hypothetical protein
LPATYCSDTAFHWRVQEDGHKVLFAPAVRVFHTVDISVRNFLGHVAMHRSYFTRVALAQGKIRAWQRLPLAALAPLYPFLLMALTAARVLRRRCYLPQFLLSMPLVFLGFCARTWGEVIGLLTPARGGTPGQDAVDSQAPVDEVTAHQ